ncbi:ABC transporter ATP-binding protein [Paraclostridium sp. AKS73]|uniref:ABC transporter ATP-binding protein n=1 Tax=Paraclostridium sp. AKS73 TaxID=2876116 RepID=UPI000B9F5E16|nr:ABC transporter ATP-binding protein [Paraclostridium sp. AKS73]MCU9814474.1 ABC transporter ATP-binding protein [Paraclostridium sp. AKS73]OXX84471.1 proline/glycine betaine ABC transporter ATP-binding protein [Paraclostridium benzoelyticum]
MLRFENIVKKFNGNYVLSDVSFEIEKGNLVAIIGESGCGKTTLLKMINRLIKPSYGKIYIDDRDISKIDPIKLRRNIGYVIQQTGLFPHMTVRENIEIISRIEKVDNLKIEESTYRLMNMVGLDPEKYLDRYPAELSGGQQQRIGVARAFATDPEIILMDEPFSALDPITRVDLQDELVELQSKFKKTIIFVTHDMDEAIRIADMICIMKDGKVMQYDTPENILKNPINNFVSDFIGKNRIWSSPEFIKISDIMIENPIVCGSELPILKCIEKMRRNKVDSLIVTDSTTKEFIGVVKAKFIRNIENKSQRIGDIVKNETPTLMPNDTILDALNITNKYKISAIPVINKNKLVQGLVTKSSLVTTLSQQYLEVEEE